MEGIDIINIIMLFSIYLLLLTIAFFMIIIVTKLTGLKLIGLLIAISLIVISAQVVHCEERHVEHEFGEETICKPETFTVFVPETTCFVNYNMYGYPSGHICFPGNSEGIITRPTCTRTTRQKTRIGTSPTRNYKLEITIGE